MENQLQLDFEKSQKDLDQALLKFTDASKKYAASLDKGNPETAAMIDDEAAQTRASVRRMVGVLASQSGLDFHSVWVLAYHEHDKRVGFHAVRASKGKGVHLDEIEKAGQMPEFQNTVAGMLSDPQYRK